MAGDRLQLALVYFRREGLGRGRSKTRLRPELMISQHAMTRLAERCDARTPVDLIVAATAIWRAAAPLGLDLGKVPATGWRVPFASGVAVVGAHDTYPDADAVRTVLPPEAPLLS